MSFYTYSNLEDESLNCCKSLQEISYLSSKNVRMNLLCTYEGITYTATHLTLAGVVEDLEA
eukprot:Awhi_evm1s13282